MNIARKLITGTVILGATLAATASSAGALSGYHDGFKDSRNMNGSSMSIDVGVNYLGLRSVDVKAVVKDAAGDNFCTVVKARLFNSNGAQLGGIITVGSVCGGQTLALPLKPISTQAGDIASVSVYGLLGASTTTASVWDHCFRATDSSNGNQHSCR